MTPPAPPPSPTPAPPPPPPPPPVAERDGRDPAAQPERTILSWRRTTLAFAVLTLFAWRGAAVGEAPLVPPVIMAAAVTGGCACLLLIAQRQRPRLDMARPAPLGQAAVLGAVGAALLAAVCGTVLVLLT